MSILQHLYLGLGADQMKDFTPLLDGCLEKGDTLFIAGGTSKSIPQEIVEEFGGNGVVLLGSVPGGT